MSKPTALILDDEPDIRELLVLTLSRMGVATRSAGSLAEAYALLEDHEFDLCLADMRLPDGDGIDLVRYLAKKRTGTPVAVITAHGNMATAVEALKAGAFDFVSKPVDLPVLRELVETALKVSHDVAPEETRSEPTLSEARLLGKSEAINSVRALIGKMARSQAPVYISGESGTGKELAARLIHELGPRADHPFVAVNCGAIPQDLMESELFGHVKGSFTGATRDKAGLFQTANGGTLFLDEVADLPLSMQVKLLRAIQEQTIRPVGTSTEIGINVRIISATHKNLAELVERGEFRQDLFYRINVIDLTMPALRDRREDIPGLIDHILERISRDSDRVKPRVDRKALKQLYNHRYAGNVRELENILERATALCEDGVIRHQDLGIEETTPNKAPRQREAEQNLEAYLAEVERDAIMEALAATKWNRTAAAKRLGISFRALRYRLEKLGRE